MRYRAQFFLKIRAGIGYIIKLGRVGNGTGVLIGGAIMRNSVLLFVWFLSTVGMSTGNTDESIQLIRYDGRPVDASALRFCWHSFNDAEEYMVEIANNLEFGCSFSGFAMDTCFIYDMELDERMWYWRVSASEYYSSESLVDSVLVTATGTSHARTRKHIRTSISPEQSYTPNGRCFPEKKSNRTQAVTVIIRGAGKEPGPVVSCEQMERTAE